MEKIQIINNLIQYQFPPRVGHPEETCGTNIYAFLDGQAALLIDSGYKEHILKVKEDLALAGIVPTQIILSHFHADHINGLKSLPGVKVFASQLHSNEEVTYDGTVEAAFIQGITNISIIRFGQFVITFQMAPGHEASSIYTIINGGIIHVADNLIAANDGSPVLPWAEYQNVEEHIHSLEMLLDLNPQILLLGHGSSIHGKPVIVNEIENRLRYLRAVKNGNGELDVEQATAECTCQFLCTHWHIRK